MLIAYILTISTLSLAAACAVAVAHEGARQVGALTFWRVGRVGGSLYIARGGRS